MVWNYLVTALYAASQRHKLYGFINIGGLAVGLCCAIFIILYLRDELSYDKWVPDSENVYQVETTFHMPGKVPDFVSAVPFVATVATQAQIAGVVAQTHLISQNMTAQIGDRQFEAKISVVDPNFFQVIKLPLVSGDPARVLAQPDLRGPVRDYRPEIFRHRRSRRQDPYGERFACAESHRYFARCSA